MSFRVAPPTKSDASARARYAVLVLGRARGRAAIAEGREPRCDYLDLADALGAKIIEAGAGGPGGPMVSRLLAAWAAFRNRAEYDVIVSTVEQVGLPLSLLLKLSRTRRGHVVIAHWLSPANRRVFFRWPGADSAIDRLVVYSSAQERVALEELRFARDKVRLILHAADSDFWHPLGNRPSGICSAGLEHRDYATLVEAIRGLDVRLTIAAGSPWTSGGPFPADGLPANVSTRRLDYHALRELYDRSEFVVVPLHDTDLQAGSLVMYEAMAMGKAVIVSNTHAHRYGDIVREGATGLLVPSGDVEALRQAIIRLHRDPEEARRMGANARRVVEEGLNHQRYVERMAAVAREVAAELLSRNGSVAPVGVNAASR